MAEQHEFEPDWCLAPAATLEEWITANGMLVRIGSIVNGGPAMLDGTRLIVGEVLNCEPLTDRHAEVLARVTDIPASYWLALEQDYRAGLAAGLKDVTGA